MENRIGKLLGSGGTATVYEWGNNEVIKVFHSTISPEVIKNEERIGIILNKFPLRIPKYLETIEWNHQNALIYERAYGRVLAEVILECVTNSDIAARFANLHYEIHQCNIDELPMCRQINIIRRT